MPEMKSSSDPFKSGVKVILGGMFGVPCMVSHHRSSDSEIVCETPNVAPDLDGVMHDEISGQFCQYRSSMVFVYVDGVGGSVNEPWNTGWCHGDSKRCNFRQGWGATSQILEVNPSIAFPGSVVTIKGRLCFSDDFDLAGLDAEDRKSVIEAGDDELRIPGLATVNQVSFGDFMCSTMDDSKTTGTFYNISGGGFEATRWSSVYSCKVGSFRCKLPEDIPRGYYTSSLVTGRNEVKPRIASNGSGRSMVAKSGSRFSDASGGFKISPDDGKPYILAVQPKIRSIEIVDNRTLRVKGELLSHDMVVTLGETILAPSANCTVTFVATDKREIICTMDSAQGRTLTHIGDQTRDKHSTAAFLSMRGGILRNRWGFVQGSSWYEYPLTENYAFRYDAKRVIDGFIEVARQPTVVDDIVGNWPLSDAIVRGLPEGFSRNIVWHQTAFFVAPQTGLYRFLSYYDVKASTEVVSQYIDGEFYTDKNLRWRCTEDCFTWKYMEAGSTHLWQTFAVKWYKKDGNVRFGYQITQNLTAAPQLAPGTDGALRQLLTVGMGSNGGVTRWRVTLDVWTPTSMSLYGLTASQSATAYGGSANRALISPPQNHYGGGTCTHTTRTRDPWWRLDLKTTKSLSSVELMNRGDCCSDRFEGLRVYLSDDASYMKHSANSIQCGQPLSSPNSAWNKFECGDGVSGRYLYVTLYGRHESLTICGVKVFEAVVDPGKGRNNYAIDNSPVHGPNSLHWHDDVADIETKNLTFVAMNETSKVNIHPPPIDTAMGDEMRDRTCAQIACDGKRNTLIRDLDGSLVGGDGGTVVAESNEVRWNEPLRYTDPQGSKTMADLIPTFAFYTRGSHGRLSASQVFEHPGTTREGCAHVPEWNGYKCLGGRQRRILFESMDADAKSRRVFPLAMNVYAAAGHSPLNSIDKGPRYMSLYTGPSMYGLPWSKKASRWTSGHLTGQVGSTHDIYLSSTNPKHTRMYLRDASPDEAVHVRIYYGLANRVDVFVAGKKVEPLASITWDSLRKGVRPPNLDATNVSYANGANYYNRITGFLEVILRGHEAVDFIVSDIIELTMGLEVSEDEFFETGYQGLLRNLASLMDIPPSRIMVVGVGSAEGAKQSSGGGERRRLLTQSKISVDFVIDPPEITADAVSAKIDASAATAANAEVNPNLSMEDATTQETIALSVDTDAVSFDAIAETRITAASQADVLSNLTAKINSLLETNPDDVFQNIDILNASSLTNISITDTSKMAPPSGWTCDRSKYMDSTCDCDCGLWDPDCEVDGNENILIRGCPMNVELNAADRANSLRAFCVNNAELISCKSSVPSSDMCSSWPCVQETPSEELVSYMRLATGGSKMTCGKSAPAENATIFMSKCSLLMLDENGKVMRPIVTNNMTTANATAEPVAKPTPKAAAEEAARNNSTDLPQRYLPAPVPVSPQSDGPRQEPTASPSRSRREVRVLVRTIDRLNSRIASEEAWIESAPRVYREKSEEETKQKNAYKAAVSKLRRLERTVRSQTRRNTRLAARGRPVVDLTQTNEHLQTAVSNVSKCKSALTIARREKKARTTSKIRRAQQNLRALKDRLRRLEGEYAAATSLTPSAGAHLGSARDRYAYSRYISLLYASTFIIGVAALASVRRRMSSDAVHVAIARGAVPTYGTVDV
jgi:hypothetical protein